MTATESAPASKTWGANSRVMPPIATSGFRVSGRKVRKLIQSNHRIGILL